ncbi:MerR family transcriptional regulator [Paraburkholderia azotifigens]|uniref:MerR family transcriptional regulator n=1 Tax=Paraburkholderia azotifigens TaxID=2057004 RepID=A0A5C6VDV7_9BURK|nr:MerR family transcriptional regulator [Paraburkholderia azotifigens]TXC83169.1 MerR family transcriptional regulator [Paraburkholderia azotifigens]
MKIGKLSKLSGVSQRMIRYYEEQGLLSPARSDSNYRHYSNDDVCRLARIRILQEAGLTLKVIHSLLPCMTDDPLLFEPCALVIDTLLEEKQKLEDRIKVLSESHAILNSHLNGLRSEPRVVVTD